MEYMFRDGGSSELGGVVLVFRHASLVSATAGAQDNKGRQ